MSPLGTRQACTLKGMVAKRSLHAYKIGTNFVRNGITYADDGILNVKNPSGWTFYGPQNGNTDASTIRSMTYVGEEPGINGWDPLMVFIEARGLLKIEHNYFVRFASAFDVVEP